MKKWVPMSLAAAIIVAGTSVWMGLSNGNTVKNLNNIGNTTTGSDKPADKYGPRLRSMLDTTQEREDKEFYPKSLMILTTNTSDYGSVAESVNQTVELRYAFPNQNLISTEPANRSEIRKIAKNEGVKYIGLDVEVSSDATPSIGRNLSLEN